MATVEEKGAAVDHRDELHDADAAVQLAHEAETNKLSPWTVRMFRLYLVLSKPD